MLAPTKKQQTARTTSIPAPIKGLNAKDSIAAMTPDFAIILDNMTCSPTTVDSRKGSVNWATGLGGNVETIAHYRSPTQGNLIAAANSNIFDATASGPVGAPKVSGLANNRWQWTNFATPGGNFLYMVNGADNPVLYDGTTYNRVSQISSPYAITGVDPSTFIHVNAFQNRLWFIPVNSLTPYYLPSEAVAGVASPFPLGSVFQMGGYIMAMMTWTIDNANGVQDYAVFITSEGEVAIYQGYDPDFAATFTLVGLFVIGRPVGRRCFVKIASDNCVICSDGIVSLSKELTTDRDISQSFSYNIQNTINNDVTTFRNNWGWQPVYYPAGTKLIVNVPSDEDNTSYQYVMNTITGAWSSWNKENPGYQALCWDVFEDILYFGTNGAVVVGDTNMDDNGVAIRWDMLPAYSYFGDLGQEKYFTMARPIILSTDKVSLSYILCTDYETVAPTVPPLSVTTGAAWDTSPWDTTPWGGSPVLNKQWLGIGGIGYAASLRINGLTQGLTASIQSIDYVYEVGGVL